MQLTFYHYFRYDMSCFYVHMIRRSLLSIYFSTRGVSVEKPCWSILNGDKKPKFQLSLLTLLRLSLLTPRGMSKSYLLLRGIVIEIVSLLRQLVNFRCIYY